MSVFEFLPLIDWIALLAFFGSWAGYAWYAGRGHADGTTLLHRTNVYRHYWLLQATDRDPRMLDGLITQNLSATPTFFSSTTIIIIGGLLAVMGASDRVNALVEGIPFVRSTSVEVFDLKLLLLIGIFVYAFFRFSWSMRLYTFVALAIGSMPPPAAFAASPLCAPLDGGDGFAVASLKVDVQVCARARAPTRASPSPVSTNSG